MQGLVAAAIHEARWQGLFEECELLFFNGGRSVSQRVPLFLFREVEHFPSRAGRQLQLKSIASRPRGRPRPLANAQVFA